MTKRLQIMTNLLAIAAVFAALVQWSIPQGWMIANDASGHIILTPCPSTAPKLTALAENSVAQNLGDHANHEMSSSVGMDHSDHESGEENAQSMCDFAALGAPLLLPDTLATEMLPLGQTASVSVPPALTPGRGLAAPPPPSTGPPHLIV